MKDKPLVSVLMPVYNSEKYLEEAIESILNQTYKNFELIIVDDLSTDNSWNIINKYARKYRKIKSIRVKKWLSIGAMRNKLLSLAKGKYIVWMDSDDISVKTRIEDQVNFMEENKEVVTCGGYLEYIDENGKTSHIRKYPLDDKSLRKRIFLLAPVSTGTSIIRTSIYKKVGKFDPYCIGAEDLDMNFRLGLAGKFANLDKLLLLYRRHKYSSTTTDIFNLKRYNIKIRLQYLNCNEYNVGIYKYIHISLFYLLLLIPDFLLINIMSKIKK